MHEEVYLRRSRALQLIEPSALQLIESSALQLIESSALQLIESSAYRVSARALRLKTLRRFSYRN
jgi:hypothetical protein